jgi:hypothetical protein
MMEVYQEEMKATVKATVKASPEIMVITTKSTQSKLEETIRS